jgi:hypothetical protein
MASTVSDGRLEVSGEEFESHWSLPFCITEGEEESQFA